MIVAPILSTAIDWHSYLAIAKQALGKSVSSRLDDTGILPNNLAAFIATLGYFKFPDESPSEILIDAGPLLRHVSYGFLVVAPVQLFYEIMESTPLDVLTTEAIRGRLGVVSGNLEQWRTAIINGDDVAEFLNICMKHFETIGLSQLWHNYRKVMLGDNTFILEIKK